MKWISNLDEKGVLSIVFGTLTTINRIFLPVLFCLIVQKFKKDNETKDDSNKKMLMVESFLNNGFHMADFTSEILAALEIPLPLGDLVRARVVYIRTPNEFWISLEFMSRILEDMVYEMTEYYNKEENRILHVLKTVILGQMVAVNRDNKWHRGKIISILNDSQYEILFMDTSSINIISRKNILELRTDIFDLDYPIVQCSLANTKPREYKWSFDACCKFQKMIISNRYTILTKIKGYKHGNGISQCSSIIYVDLYGFDGYSYFNIGEALKHLELAQFEEDVYSTADSGLSQDEQDFLSFIFSVGKNSSDIRDETDFSICTNN